MTYNIHCTSKASFVFIGTLLSSAAWYVTPASADASLDELKARLERAEKENIVLKTEKVERENITMKLEKIEAENAALRNETKVDKTPTASIPTKKSFSTSSSSQEVKTVARREAIEANSSAPREQPTARKEINNALEKIPKDDAKREMTAAYKAPKEEVPVVMKQWQGIYAGINAGYGEGQANYSGNATGPVNYNAGPGTAWFYPQIYQSYPSLYSMSGVINFSGPVAGGQIGYNHQFNNHVILGAEIDLDYADINNRYGIAGANKISQVSQTGMNNLSYNDRTGVNWLGTARLRLGYDLGKFLPYITAGFAYGSVSNNSFGLQQYISSNNTVQLYAGNSVVNNSSVNVGWAAGAGAEYIVADNWSVKGEYLYTQLAGLNINGYPTAINTGSNPNLAGTSVLNGIIGPWSIHQARVGLNYHTDWLASKPAVTAKY
jgi:outer membrane immunogenic protein